MKQKKFCHYCSTKLTDKYFEGRIRRFCEHCNQPLYENPIPAACVILTDKTGRLLLVKRSVEPKKGLWCLPGGFMELGETPEQTALRELQEETGLTGQIDRIISADSSNSETYNTVALICYSISRYSGNPFPGDDACDLDFFNPDDLPELAFKSHKKFISFYFNPSSAFN
ncbi:Hydrolase, NUDIX family [Desulfonema limicola]|uniref:Hydrolase, NUDIX family n=1 Tax=Desulfonema limicola TaxID=45656 RepID=A0A975GI65_9BACT|nr:NUDIX domain-containing protein [Desulfonema limicola]QTA82320.1 Hydrolase, NUDIX family [Desulfonema limicola]